MCLESFQEECNVQKVSCGGGENEGNLKGGSYSLKKPTLVWCRTSTQYVAVSVTRLGEAAFDELPQSSPTIPVRDNRNTSR